MKTFLAAAVGLAALIAMFPLRSAAQTPPNDDQIRALLKERVDDRKVAPGIVVGLIDKNGARVISFGKTSVGGPAEVDGDTLFEIGSATKVFTALLLADMARQGEVNLDDPIAKFLPAGAKAPGRDGRQITLRDLATQSSGLPRLPDNFTPADAENPYADYTAEKMYAFLSGYSLTRGIGEKYEYSNFGMGLLGNLLSRSAGTNYEALVRSRVWSPLGMNDTTITLSPVLRPRLAAGYEEKLQPVKPWDFDALAGAGAIRSTAHDMLKFLAANLNLAPSQLWPAMQSMQQPTDVVVNQNTRMGLAWHISERNGKRIIWHNGQTGGYHSFLGIDPTNQIGVVILANSANGVEDLGYRILDNTPPKEHRIVVLDAKVLDRYIGQYELAPGIFFTIKRNDSRLVARLTGQSFLELFPEDETNFFYKVVDAQITFLQDAQGRVTALVLHQNGLDQTAKKISDQVPRERQAIKLAPEILEPFVGEYELAPGAIFTVRREGDSLKAQLTGQPYFEIFPEDETNFFYTVVDAQITFMKEAGGKIAALVLHQNGDRKALKIK